MLRAQAFTSRMESTSRLHPIADQIPNVSRNRGMFGSLIVPTRRSYKVPILFLRPNLKVALKALKLVVHKEGYGTIPVDVEMKNFLLNAIGNSDTLEVS